MSQAAGGGSLLSFETGDVELSKGLVEHSKLFKARATSRHATPPHFHCTWARVRERASVGGC